MGYELISGKELKEKIVSRIKDSFAELVPEEAWQKLVDEETKNFIENDLKKLIKDELGKKFEEKIKLYLNSPDFSDSWDYNYSQYTPSKAVEEIVRKMIPNLVEAMFSEKVNCLIQQVRNQMY